MRQPFAQLFVHLVWATWDRLPLITPHLEAPLYACMCAECRKLKVEVIALNGVEDHVHLLVRIPTTIAVAELAKQVKGSSSHLATHEVPGGDGFKWQGAYGAFSVSPHDVPAVREYVDRQKEHHATDHIDDELERIFIDVDE